MSAQLVKKIVVWIVCLAILAVAAISMTEIVNSESEMRKNAQPSAVKPAEETKSEKSKEPAFDTHTIFLLMEMTM